jgi:uncharacterized protein DUF4837
MKNIFVIIGMLIALVSCNSGKNKLILKSSTGRINSMLVVIKNKQWNSQVGTTLKKLANVPVAGVAQPEMQFRVTQISPNKFNALFENNRNILVVGIAPKATFKITANKYAEPQIFITITGKNEADLIAQIKLHIDEIIRAFKQGDLSLYQQKLSKKVWDNKEFLALNKFKMIVPKKYRVVENTSAFLWLRKHLANDGTLNILAYTMPLTQETLTQSDILNKRDSIGKKYLPGQLLNSYMQTSYELEPTMTHYKINGVEAYEIRGIWEVKNDFMGGSFINYSIIDTKNKRVLCLDGFVYAPNQDKRDYIFELEAIFKSLKFK